MLFFHVVRLFKELGIGIDALSHIERRSSRHLKVHADYVRTVVETYALRPWLAEALSGQVNAYSRDCHKSD